MLHPLLIALMLACGTAASASRGEAAPTSDDQSDARSVCTMEYRPVCARTRFGRLRTYSNACVARRAKARVIYRGVCGSRR